MVYSLYLNSVYGYKSIGAALFRIAMPAPIGIRPQNRISFIHPIADCRQRRWASNLEARDRYEDLVVFRSIYKFNKKNEYCLNSTCPNIAMMQNVRNHCLHN